jgi:hypothetical protein
MVIKTTSRPNYILTKQDIFDSVNKRIAAGHAGATIFVPHVCNNIDLFGAGFAAAIAQEYPVVKANYHMLGKNFLKNNLGHSQIVKLKEDKKYKHALYAVNMIAQNGIRSASNPRPLNYAALVKSMIQVSHFIQNNTGFSAKTENIEIHAPKFGSGLAGGNWNFISDLIEDIWGRYTVFVYQHNQKS